jgi:hypothetical protein
MPHKFAQTNTSAASTAWSEGTPARSNTVAEKSFSAAAWIVKALVILIPPRSIAQRVMVV